MYKTLNSRNNGADQEGGYNMTTRYLPDLTLPYLRYSRQDDVSRLRVPCQPAGWFEKSFAALRGMAFKHVVLSSRQTARSSDPTRDTRANSDDNNTMLFPQPMLDLIGDQESLHVT